MLPPRDVVLYNTAVYGAVTANGNSGLTLMPYGYENAIVSVNVGTVTGTSPTLALFIQNQLAQSSNDDPTGRTPDGTPIYDDLAAFTSITATSVRIVRLGPAFATPVSGSTLATMDYAQSDGSLTAGSIRLGPIGNNWRLKWTVGGTSPVFNFSVSVQLC